MTRYIIIEDERFAYEEIKRMMTRLRPEWLLAGWADSVEQAALLLGQGQADLLISDIRLTDGLCFEIFSRCGTDIPVIFTTAYDEYAIRAFKVSGIDYLLKPIEESDLEAALTRFERGCSLHPSAPECRRMEQEYVSEGCKSRFLVQAGDMFRYADTGDVAFFYSEDKYTYLHLFGGNRYIVDYTLDRLETILDGKMFFRVSRNCIANIRAVRKGTRYFGGRMKLHLSPECPHEVFVSRSRAADFLRWMDGDGCRQATAGHPKNREEETPDTGPARSGSRNSK